MLDARRVALVLGGFCVPAALAVFVWSLSMDRTVSQAMLVAFSALFFVPIVMFAAAFVLFYLFGAVIDAVLSVIQLIAIFLLWPWRKNVILVFEQIERWYVDLVVERIMAVYSWLKGNNP